MARKKAEREETNQSKDYEIQIGYINNFEYNDPTYAESMNGHPHVGGVYRMIKDNNGYRLHIGREVNNLGLDGLFLGKELSGQQQDFIFEVTLVNNKNFLKLKLDKKCAAQVAEWLESGSPDLWERIKMENDGIAPVVKKMSDLKEFLNESDLQDIIEKAHSDTQDELTDFEQAMGDYLQVSDTEELSEALQMNIRMNLALSTIYEKDEDMMESMIGLMEYIASTYGDKYESAEIPNLSKHILINTGVMGKGANVFNIFKYTQRYATTGFQKSENPQDLLKVIHYALFELQRKRNMKIDPTDAE